MGSFLQLAKWGLVLTFVVNIHAFAQQPDGATSDSSPLFSADVAQRREFAISLQETSTAELVATLPLIIQSLNEEKDSQVRLALLDSLMVLGDKAQPATVSLVESLKNKKVESNQEEQHQDLRIALILGNIGPTAIDGLLELLHVEDRHQRAAAALAIGRMQHVPPAAIEQLLGVVDDESDLVRREVVQALAAIGPAANSQILTAYASEPELPVSVLLSFSQWDNISPELQAKVIRSLHSADSGRRAAATTALARCNLSIEEKCRWYVEALQDADASVRHAAGDVIINDRQLISAMRPDLERLVAKADQEVVQEAAFLLVSTGVDAMDSLLAVVREEASNIEMIGKSLARLGRSGVERLVAALASGSTAERACAAYALGEILPTSETTIEALCHGLNDSRALVQSQCLAALAKLGPRARSGLGQVVAMLDGNNTATRESVVDAIVAMSPRDHELVQRLTELLNSQASESIKIKVVDQLRSLGPLTIAAIPVVTHCLADPSPQVRLAAANFIGSHGASASDSLMATQALLSDDSSAIRLAGVEAIMQMRDSAASAFPALTVRLEEDSSLPVRIAALKAMAMVRGDTEIMIPYVEKAMKVEEKDLRLEALRVAGRLESAASILVPDIIALAVDNDLKKPVERALRSFRKAPMGQEQESRLIALSESSNVDVGVLAVEFLGYAQHDTGRVVGVLESLKMSTEATVVEAATAALERIENKGSER